MKAIIFDVSDVSLILGNSTINSNKDSCHNCTPISVINSI